MSYSSPFGWGGFGAQRPMIVPNKIQGSAPEAPGDQHGPSTDEVKMRHARDGLIVGAVAFLAAKYSFNSDTTKSLMIGAGIGAGTYYYLCNTTWKRGTTRRQRPAILFLA